MNKPKVSVIIPVYGVEKYIERCARSLFEQTLDDTEFILIDDCTPDRSIDVLQSVLEEYPDRKSQVQIHRMLQNSGQAKVREFGYQCVTGEYVIHCDTDDWLDVNAYQLMYEKAKEEEADMVVCDYYIAESIDNTIVQGLLSTSIDKTIRHLLTNECAWSLWNKLIRSTLFTDGFVYPKCNMGEDMMIILEVLTKTKKLSYATEPLYYNFKNPMSICNDVSAEKALRNYNQVVSNLEVAEKIYKQKKLYRRYGKEFVYRHFMLKKVIQPYVSNANVYVTWLKSYPCLIMQLLFCKYITIQELGYYYLTYFKLNEIVYEFIHSGGHELPPPYDLCAEYTRGQRNNIKLAA